MATDPRGLQEYKKGAITDICLIKFDPLLISTSRWISCLEGGRLRRRCWGRISGRSTEPCENWTGSEWSWSSRRRRLSLTSRKWPNRGRWWGRGACEQSFVCTGRMFTVILSFRSLQDAVKIMAKDLVRTRRYVKKFIMMKANIQAVSLKIQTLKSNNSMAQAMKGVTKAMATMNRQVR